MDDKAACLKHSQSLGGSRVGGRWEQQYFIFANYYLYYHNSFSQKFLSALSFGYVPSLTGEWDKNSLKMMVFEEAHSIFFSGFAIFPVAKQKVNCLCDHKFKTY